MRHKIKDHVNHGYKIEKKKKKGICYISTFAIQTYMDALNDKKFYKKYKYPLESLQSLKYDWHGEHALDIKEEDRYEKMLLKNGIVIDREVSKRIADIDKY